MEIHNTLRRSVLQPTEPRQYYTHSLLVHDLPLDRNTVTMILDMKYLNILQYFPTFCGE
jgi:hypothetical protein